MYYGPQFRYIFPGLFPETSKFYGPFIWGAVLTILKWFLNSKWFHFGIKVTLAVSFITMICGCFCFIRYQTSQNFPSWSSGLSVVITARRKCPGKCDFPGIYFLTLKSAHNSNWSTCISIQCSFADILRTVFTLHVHTENSINNDTDVMKMRVTSTCHVRD